MNMELKSSFDKTCTTPVYQWGEQFIQSIDLSDSKRILDIGCRDGRLSQKLANQYSKQEITALDINNNSITSAKANNLYSNLSFEQNDLTHLETESYYDAVFSSSYLHWVEDKFQVFKQIYAALKPQGKAYLQFFAQHGNPKNDRFLFHTAKLPNWKSYFNHFTPSYYEVSLAGIVLLLQKVGFTIKYLKFIDHKIIFNHPDELMTWLKTWACHIKRLPIKKQDHFILEATNHYLKAHHHTEYSAFPYHEYLLHIVCEKSVDVINGNYGCFNFTPQEKKVLKHYLSGCSAKEIARYLNISNKTVEYHIHNIRNKTATYRRSELFNKIIEGGFVDLLF